MASRRSKKGTPKKRSKVKPPLKPKGRKRRLSRSKANIARRKRYRLLKQSNVEVLRKGRDRKAVAVFTGRRDEMFDKVKDFLSDFRPAGGSYLFVEVPGENPYSSKVGDWQFSYKQVDVRAIAYMNKKMDVDLDENIKVSVVLLGY